jgi:cystathionine gamma-synthase/cystathionine beta-lyase
MLRQPDKTGLGRWIARLDEGAQGFAYASGMAAIANLFLLFKRSDYLDRHRFPV